jgi:hypothetical protein
MKLLPKKQDIDKAKSDERKKEIDEGLDLARKVETLRELKLSEEKNLRDWRDNSVKVIQQSIDSLLEQEIVVRRKVAEAIEARKKLLEPLDKEWDEVNETKKWITKEKERIYLSGERLKIEEVEVEKKNTLATKLLETIKQKNSKLEVSIAQSLENESRTEKAYKEVEAFKIDLLSRIVTKEESITKREHDLAQREEKYQTDIALFNKEKKQLELKKSRWKISQ